MNKSIIAVSASAMLLTTLSFGTIAEDASVNCDCDEWIDPHIALIKSTC